MEQAEQDIFGVVLMNDWSARDIQKWEYVPLGPFGAKNFGTTISPWVVPMEALEPFRCSGPAQEEVQLLPYLQPTQPQAYDIQLSCGIIPREGLYDSGVVQRGEGQHLGREHSALSSEYPGGCTNVCSTNAKFLYYSMAQQLCHHTVSGCNMNPGDLLGSGTISGPEKGSLGSMLEISWKGTRSVSMKDGSQRKFLQDYDTVVMRGVCIGEGFKIGFGDCSGQILPPFSPSPAPTKRSSPYDAPARRSWH